MAYMGLIGLFQRKPKCPNCNSALQAKPTRKQECPHCNNVIFVRNGELVSEEQATILDWLGILENFGINRKDFDEQRSELSKQFGIHASVNDTLWRIFNNLIITYASDTVALEQIYREMAKLVSNEGKDPTQYLVEAEKVRKCRPDKPIQTKKQVFLGHNELKYVRGLRKEGKLDKAEELLLKAEPSPAVLDELRKIASTRAKAARKEGDWEVVVQYLEGYTTYSNQWREHCIKMVNQEPPTHTESDTMLLQEAKDKLAGRTT
jgi:hypothetical protein